MQQKSTASLLSRDERIIPEEQNMGGWLRYLALNAQIRAGLSVHALIWAAVAALCAALALVLIAAFFWLADRYDPIKAGFILAGAFAAVPLLAAALAMMVRARSIARAQAELAQRQKENAAWLDPKLIAAGLQMGQGIGWRRLGSLAVVALVAAAVAYDWFGEKQPEDNRNEEKQ
jgi:hypothetical protein